jgi:hypothetical protein
MLNLQTIRNNVSIEVNRELVQKPLLIELSKEWEYKQEALFRKMLKQGGSFKINGNLFKININDEILNSKGEKDTGVIVYPE